MWKYKGQQRPSFAIKPDQGQESVWDYPRPPMLVLDNRLIEVKSGTKEIGSTRNAYRILETASPPTFYIPPEDINRGYLIRAGGSSFCEWKGAASYWGVQESLDPRAIGWSYENPSPAFEQIKGYYSFYPAYVECYVNGELVRPQPGRFYGGWVTDDVVGPFKGEPGTSHW